MDNKAPQRESRVVLVILGTLFACICLTLVGIGYIVTTRSGEIATYVQTAAYSSAGSSSYAQATPGGAGPENILVSDTFENGVANYNWDIGRITSNSIQGERAIQYGTYQFDAEASTLVPLVVLPHHGNARDFQVQADVLLGEGAVRSNTGLVFRYRAPDSYYTFSIRSDGAYSVFSNTEGQWFPLQTWQRSSAIHPQGWNHLRVVGKGTVFSFWINNIFVTTVTNQYIDSGGAGFAIDVGAGDTVHFEYDNFEFRGSEIVPALTPSAPRTLTAAPTTEIVAVPNVVSISIIDALHKLYAAGLNANINFTTSKGCSGRVVRQEPDPGTQIKRGAKVNLDVCRDATATPIP